MSKATMLLLDAVGETYQEDVASLRSIDEMEHYKWMLTDKIEKEHGKMLDNRLDRSDLLRARHIIIQNRATTPPAVF